MNSASTNLPKHITTLQEKLSHPTDYELAFSYFMQEFGGDLGFHSEGTPNDAPHLRTALSAIITKAIGQSVNSEQFVCSFLHAHDFFHGHATTTDNTVVFFYFAKANIGLATIISFTGGTQQVARFQLPKLVAGNPGHN